MATVAANPYPPMLLDAALALPLAERLSAMQPDNGGIAGLVRQLKGE